MPEGLQYRLPLDEPPPFQIKDFVCRVEWQKRGFPHAHILLWLKDETWQQHEGTVEARVRTPVTEIAPPVAADSTAGDGEAAEEPVGGEATCSSIWPLYRRDVEDLLRGAVTLLASPHRLRPKQRWVACREDVNPARIVAVLFHGEAREICSDEEWLKVKERTQRRDPLKPRRPFFRTYVVQVELCQALVDTIPYKIGKETSARMHIFRPLFDEPYRPSQLLRLVLPGGDAARGASTAAGSNMEAVAATVAEDGSAGASVPPALVGLPQEDAGDMTETIVSRAARQDDIPSIYDKYVWTTSPMRWLETYKDLTMYQLTQSLEHKHTPYCGKVALGYCRFGFPHEPIKRTVLKDARKRWAQKTKQRYMVRRREDAQFMGLYNPVILRRWRASMDLQVVESGHAVAHYILGYVLKNDTEREALLRVQHFLSTLPATSPVQAQTIYRLAYMTWQGRVTSTFEACHMLLGLPVVRCSRQFQWVHTGQPDAYSAYVPRRQEQAVLEDPEAADSPSAPAVLQRYEDWRAAQVAAYDNAAERPRPRSLHVRLLVEGETEAELHVPPTEVTLFDAVASYIFKPGGEVELRKRPAVVAFKSYDPDEDSEAYYYAKLLLHYPWSTLRDSTGCPSWLEKEDESSHQKAFLRLLEKRPSATEKLNGQQGEAAGAADAAVEAMGDPDPDEGTNPGFLHSRVFPKTNIAETTWRELRRLNTTLVMRSVLEGTEAAAQDFADHQELLRTLRVKANRGDGEDEASGSDAEMEEAAGAVPNTDAFGTVHGGEDAVTMLFGEGAPESRQRSIVAWFVERVRSSSGATARNPARVVLHGPGGCGKSVVVRALATLLRSSKHGVAITAPTGCAAFLIGGCTLHACLRLPVENNTYGRASDAPLPSGPVLQHLIDFWRPIRVLVIDELSMVSAEMLARIDQHLQLFKRRQGVPFGGLHVLMAGDLYQLPPPKGKPIYAAPHLWKLFAVCELEGNHRAAADPRFAELLARLRVGKATAKDLATLRGRVQRPPADGLAVHLYSTRKDVARVNDRLFKAFVKRAKLREYVALAADVFQDNGAPVEDSSEVADDPENTAGLESHTSLAVGARVMLRRNLDISDGLVNGARGRIASIVTAPDGDEVLSVDVDFDHGGARTRQEHAGTSTITIRAVNGAFLGLSGRRIVRRQFPLVLAYAMTIHKSQGATERAGVVVSLDRSVNQPCQAYVALSRVQRLEDLILTSFEPSAIIAATGVDSALLQLRLQQALIAEGPERPSLLWLQCFKPAQTVDELDATLRSTPMPPWLEKIGDLLDARAAEAAGAQREHVCDQCGAAFYSGMAVKAHQQRDCRAARRSRKRPAAWAACAATTSKRSTTMALAPTSAGSSAYRAIPDMWSAWHLGRWHSLASVPSVCSHNRRPFRCGGRTGLPRIGVEV